MRYALLDYLACQRCHVALTCVTALEIDAAAPVGRFAAATRVSSGVGVGPSQEPVAGDLGVLLGRLAGPCADPARNLTVEVAEGLLVCAQCGRWYPVHDQIPEILPDHLRNRERERELFPLATTNAPRELITALERFDPSAEDATDAGAHHKASEIGIADKVDGPAFFGPGYRAPFNPWDTRFSLSLVEQFGLAAPLLEVGPGDAALDSGCGYAWTTEWLFRSGVDAIGVDICRAYLDIAVRRMGTARPHLVVGDVEHLPLRDACVRAALAYESFHHVPDRPRAMRGYCRVLLDGGRLVLSEPGGAHEDAQGSVDAMTKYGILEKGMDLEDVELYIAGTTFEPPQQQFVVRAGRHDLNAPFDLGFARGHSVIRGNVFVVVKGRTVLAYFTGAPAARRRMWPKVKRRLKAILLRFGLD